MNTKRLIIWAGAALLGLSSFSLQATPFLFDYGFNIDGSSTYFSDPAEVDLTGFNTTTGLGSITATIAHGGSAGAEAHYFGALFDHEIDEILNGFNNETGQAFGVAAAGQSWEIDTPNGFFYSDFEGSTLLNTNFIDGFIDDVAMAMAWDFSLAIGETATISLSLTDVLPAAGFYLHQNDPDSGGNVYLSSSLSIRGGGVVPEPSIFLLFGIGLVGMAVVNRRRLKV